jgi:3-carboxy-cis,cis-muconate cycloisomerase
VRLQRSPSQTVGPYLSLGLPWTDGPFVVREGTDGAVWIRGSVTDAAGDPVPDGMIETWQADPEGRFNHPDDPRGPRVEPGFRGFGRSLTGPEGDYAILTVKPGRVPAFDGGLQAPHVDVTVFARGLLKHLVTRLYFGRGVQRGGPVLAQVTDPARRATLLAARTATATVSTFGCKAKVKRLLRCLSPRRPVCSTMSWHAGASGRVSDRAWLQAMLDVEAALARAEARAGVISSETQAIEEPPGRDFRYLRDKVRGGGGGNPVIPLVKALTAAVQGDAARQVHRGATSQDVSDTAAMLVAKRALAPLLEDVDAASEAAATLAANHRTTAMAGRTLLQHALPITFGEKAAGWMSGLDASAARLDEVRRTRLAVQSARLVNARVARNGRPGRPRPVRRRARTAGTDSSLAHRARASPTSRAPWFGRGRDGKIAGDVALLAQTEVGEVREGVAGRGGSSTLPHKRNPIAAVLARAAADQAPGLIGTLLASMRQEHERAAGAWHAEWRPLTELLRFVGAAAAWLRDCLEHLEVDADRMRANLDLTGGLLLAERVTTALAPALGRMAAHELVEAAAAEVGGDRSFAQAMTAARGAGGSRQKRSRPCSIGYLGSAGSSPTARSKPTGAWASVGATPRFVCMVEEGPADAPALVLSGSLG